MKNTIILKKLRQNSIWNPKKIKLIDHNSIFVDE